MTVIYILIVLVAIPPVYEAINYLKNKIDEK